MRGGPGGWADFGVGILNVIGGSCGIDVVVIARIFDTAVLVSGRVVTNCVRLLRRRSRWLRVDSGGASAVTLLGRLTLCWSTVGLVVFCLGTLGGCSVTLGGTVSLEGRSCCKKIADRRSSATAVDSLHAAKGALGAGFLSTSIRQWAASVASSAVVIWGTFFVQEKNYRLRDSFQLCFWYVDSVAPVMVRCHTKIPTVNAVRAPRS